MPDTTQQTAPKTLYMSQEELKHAYEIACWTGNAELTIHQLLTHVAKLQNRCRTLENTQKAAIDLYDNRLGHRDDNPLWSAPQDLWRKLGTCLGENKLVG